MRKNLVLLFFLSVFLGGCFEMAIRPVTWSGPARYGTYYGRDYDGQPYYERSRSRSHKRRYRHNRHYRHHHGGGQQMRWTDPYPQRDMRRILPPNSGSR